MLSEVARCYGCYCLKATVAVVVTTTAIVIVDATATLKFELAAYAN